MLSLENLVSFWCLIHTFIYAFIYFSTQQVSLGQFLHLLCVSLSSRLWPTRTKQMKVSDFISELTSWSFLFFSLCLLRILQSLTGGYKLDCHSESPIEGGFRGLLFGIYMWCVVLTCFSCVQLFVTPWTVAHLAPLSMGFSRQEYWSGLLCPPPADLPDPGITPASLCLLHWEVGSLPLVPPGKPNIYMDLHIIIPVPTVVPDHTPMCPDVFTFLWFCFSRDYWLCNLLMCKRAG